MEVVVGFAIVHHFFSPEYSYTQSTSPSSSLLQAPRYLMSSLSAEARHRFRGLGLVLGVLGDAVGSTYAPPPNPRDRKANSKALDIERGTKADMRRFNEQLKVGDDVHFRAPYLRYRRLLAEITHALNVYEKRGGLVHFPADVSSICGDQKVRGFFHLHIHTMAGVRARVRLRWK